MQLTKTCRGFEIVDHPAYLPEHGVKRLVGASSAIGDYDDAPTRPGSSYLWVGENHHLNREEVAELAQRLLRWTETGSLALTGEDEPTRTA